MRHSYAYLLKMTDFYSVKFNHVTKMNEKETLLTLIKENGWVTGVRRFDLISDLQGHYQIRNDISEALLQECLAEGLIVVNNDKYSLSRRGHNYLQDIARNNFINVAHCVANTVPHSREKVGKAGFWEWITRWGTIIGIPASLAGIVALLLTLPHC
jgi:hypothetical protein